MLGGKWGSCPSLANKGLSFGDISPPEVAISHTMGVHPKRKHNQNNKFSKDKTL